MKKLLYFSLVFLIATAILPSCNKKLKKELEELDNSVADLKAKNAALEEQLATTNSTLNNINETLETNNPVKWTIDATDNSSSPGISLSKSYSAKLLLGTKDNYQYIWNISSTVWEIYVEKYEDFDWTNQAYFDIYYDVNTNSLSSAYNHIVSAKHYSDYDNGTWFEASANTGNVGETVSISSIDLNTTTGDVDVKLNWSNSVGSTFGNAEDGTIEFKGTCFNYN